MTIKPLALRRTPFRWDYEDSVTPEMRTSFNLYSMYLTGASPLPPETRLSSSSVSSRSLFATASDEVSLVLLMIFYIYQKRIGEALSRIFKIWDYLCISLLHSYLW